MLLDVATSSAGGRRIGQWAGLDSGREKIETFFFAKPSIYSSSLKGLLALCTTVSIYVRTAFILILILNRSLYCRTWWYTHKAQAKRRSLVVWLVPLPAPALLCCCLLGSCRFRGKQSNPSWLGGKGHTLISLPQRIPAVFPSCVRCKCQFNVCGVQRLRYADSKQSMRHPVTPT